MANFDIYPLNGVHVCGLLQVLEEARAHLEEEEKVLEGQLNLVQLEATALQEKCAALEVSSALPNISLEPLVVDTE